MGGYFSRPRRAEPAAKAQTSKSRREVFDISVHSCSNHTEREGEENIDTIQVLENILIDEGEQEGLEAANSAAREAFGSGELGSISAMASRNIARSCSCFKTRIFKNFVHSSVHQEKKEI